MRETLLRALSIRRVCAARTAPFDVEVLARLVVSRLTRSRRRFTGVLGNDPLQTIAENYLGFSRYEAAGKSPLYAELTAGVANDKAMLEFLAERPPAKRQPNLLLAAVRYLFGVQRDYGSFRTVVLDHREAVREVLEQRRTQTNEPARCAVLLPSLAMLPQPLALLEVGAAGGLCLLPDRYGYQYGSHRIGSPELVFDCVAYCDVPVPLVMPEIVWRAGIDLNPIDLNDDDAVRWLEALVWPDQPGRAAGLQQAITIARRDPPRVIAGDLLDHLEQLASEAPQEATLVVFHTAVLSYLDDDQRHEFARLVQRLGVEWLSNEGDDVTPGVRLAPNTPAPHRAAHFVIAQNQKPTALCDPHGAWIQWLQ
jgi:hypothetical protein